MERQILVSSAMGLDFTTDLVQIYHDSWRGTNRTCRYRGDCRACDRRTYAFDDGQNDPRGPLGDHAYWPVENATGVKVTACAVCANDYDAYTYLYKFR
jgi:hypothetical protein